MEKQLRDMKRIIVSQTQSINDVANRTLSTPVTSPFEATAVSASGPSALPEKTTLLYLDVLLLEKSLEGISVNAYLIKDLLEK